MENEGEGDTNMKSTKPKPAKPKPAKPKTTNPNPSSGKFKAKAKYLPLMIFQIILLVLYFVFVKYEADVIEVDTPAPPAAPRAGEPVPRSFGYSTSGGDFEDVHVMIFIGFGFLMTFLKKYCYSAVGLNLLLAALSIQWAVLCQNFFHMKGSNYIVITKRLLLEADVMSATVLITFGALLGITSTFQILFLAIIEIAAGCANIYLIGHIFKAADVGGSMAIHVFGAYFGLGASLALRKSKQQRLEAQQTASGGWLSRPIPSMAVASYNSDITAMIGTLFLWVYWPSFNSALASYGYAEQRAVVNTYLSLASATVTTFFVSVLVTRGYKLDMVHVQNSTLAGGVAVGSVCNMYISPGGAIAIGIGAGIISVLGYKYITPKLASRGILDTCGVHNLHGLPGILSGLLSIVFAFLAKEEKYGKHELEAIFPAGGGVSQALSQLYALLATLAISLLVGLGAGFIAKRLPSLTDEQKYIDEPNWELPA